MSNSRGRNPATLTHEYVMVATFVIPQSEVDQLAAARVDPSGEGHHNVQLTQDKMISLDGPGCKVCGLEWTLAYGQPCKGSFDLGEIEQKINQGPTAESGLILPNGQDSGRGGLLLPEGYQMPSAAAEQPAHPAAPEVEQ